MYKYRSRSHKHSECLLHIILNVQPNNNIYMCSHSYYKLIIISHPNQFHLVQFSQFASDIGGTIGLWIGLSLLSICEVFHLFGQIAINLFLPNRKAAYDRDQRKKANNHNNSNLNLGLRDWKRKEWRDILVLMRTQRREKPQMNYEANGSC